MFRLCSCQCLSREAQGHELSNCKGCAMQRWYVVSFAFSQCQEEEVVLVPAIYSGPTEHQDALVSTDIILNNPIVWFLLYRYCHSTRLSNLPVVLNPLSDIVGSEKPRKGDWSHSKLEAISITHHDTLSLVFQLSGSTSVYFQGWSALLTLFLPKQAIRKIWNWQSVAFWKEYLVCSAKTWVNQTLPM